MSPQQLKPRKPKSPPVPSKSLEGCVADVKKLYTEYSHGTFSRSELASALGVSAGSGPFATRLAALRQFGLIEASGTDYKVSENFVALNSNARDSAAFKTTAFNVVKLPATFRELLDDFPNKLPSKDAVSSRLETQKKFNKEAAVRAATVLEESLRYAGVIDGNNNILPVRDGAAAVRDTKDETEQTLDLGGTHTIGALHVEVPVGERKVVIHYPHDLTTDEAKKVGAVLAAIVS